MTSTPSLMILVAGPSVAAAGDTPVRFVDAPDAGHFDVIAPTSTSWGLVTQALRALFSRIRP